MALTTRAESGLAYAAAIAGVTVAAFKESILETKGLEWADQSDIALVARRAAKLKKAPKAVLDAIDTIVEG